MAAYNLIKTWQTRPAKYAEVEVEVPPRVRDAATAKAEHHGHWHRKFEGLPTTFSVLVALAVIVASLFEIIPTFLIKSNVPKIATVKPYTPLELYGRDIYIREGCYNCHSQMVRPFVDETVRYGLGGVPTEYSKPGEFIYDHPFQWGSRRIGPDLAREGGRRDEYWHLRHLDNPRSTSKGSIMPRYPHLLKDNIDYGSIQARINAMVTLGVPYGADAKRNAAALARAQAEEVGAKLVKNGGPTGKTHKDVIALIAYLQRLGVDIRAGRNDLPAPAAPVEATPTPAPAAPAGN
jgi:cytochrome c oxidase cbb3-type subunit I/II